MSNRHTDTHHSRMDLKEKNFKLKKKRESLWNIIMLAKRAKKAMIQIKAKSTQFNWIHKTHQNHVVLCHLF